MKKRTLRLLLATACVGLAAFGTRAQITIMPFGDSVTSRGSTPESSYRYWLWTYLQNAGFNNIAFVGSQYGVSDGTPANSNFDQHYEGGDGWATSDGVYDLGRATSYDPNIVLLDLGANDVEDGTDLGTTTTNLETIIQGFYSVNPGVVILLADPTPWVTSDRTQKAQMSKLKGAINKVAQAEKRSGVQIIKVNLWGGFNPQKDTKDGTHPNIQGEQMIAKKFFGPLKRVLKKMG